MEPTESSGPRFDGGFDAIAERLRDLAATVSTPDGTPPAEAETAESPLEPVEASSPEPAPTPAPAPAPRAAPESTPPLEPMPEPESTPPPAPVRLPAPEPVSTAVGQKAPGPVRTPVRASGSTPRAASRPAARRAPWDLVGLGLAWLALAGVVVVLLLA